MKFLTVCFIIFYTYQLFNQNKFDRKFAEKYKGLTDEEINKKVEQDFTDKDKLKDTLKTIAMIFVVGFIPPVVEIFYIAFAFQYAEMTTLAYLIFWLGVLFIGRYRNKKLKGKFFMNDKIGKYSIKQMIVTLCDLSYFIFMFYILFIR